MNGRVMQQSIRNSNILHNRTILQMDTMRCVTIVSDAINGVTLENNVLRRADTLRLMLLS